MMTDTDIHARARARACLNIGICGDPDIRRVSIYMYVCVLDQLSDVRMRVIPQSRVNAYLFTLLFAQSDVEMIT